MSLTFLTTGREKSLLESCCVRYLPNPAVKRDCANKPSRSAGYFYVIRYEITHFWDLERGNPYLITSFPTPDSVIGYQQVTPNPQRLVEDQVGDDYIVLTQRPNYQSEAACRIFRSSWCAEIAVPDRMPRRRAAAA